MLLVIQGKVDDWRVQRRGIWCTMAAFIGSKEMPQVWELYSLPYDDELKKMEKDAQSESLEDWYRLASEESRNFKWN